ncbi:ABC transporter permease [Variovorax sp. J31P207]|uniref:ABC transporter permease n=1 Tax=Variovorax sp. J31P207 TaxID=3053510 RepID=UPI002578FF9B|nr:ABC transporter permease [Variovorax sp. J31P207]MDM0071516.1 ABC transporter permease [Variovorax sp. J31P207]
MSMTGTIATSMASAAGSTPPPARRFNLRRHRSTLLAMAVFVAMFVLLAIANKRAPSYFGVSSLLASGTTLALAAIGQTIVVIGGGLDLSVGAIVGLVNAVLVTLYPASSNASPILMVGTAVLLGSAVGAVNGFFIAKLRLQPIIVTLSTMFVLRGLTLLVLSKPGGSVPDAFAAMLVDDVIPNVLPSPLVTLVVALAVWGLVRNSALGTEVFAAGSDEASGQAAGLNVARGKWASYALAGAFYGLAGAFVSAQAGAGDPLIGTPLLLSSFTAVVLGGTMIGGGRGSCLGTVFGAFTLLQVVNVLLALGLPDYYSSGVEGLVLVLAVLVNRDRLPHAVNELRRATVRWQAWRRGVGAKLVGAPQGWVPPVSLTPAKVGAFDPSAGPSSWKRWWGSRRETASYVLPAWGALLVVALVSWLYYGAAFDAPRYLDRLLVLGAFLAVLALGQGAVIMAGGLDLSIAWSITSTGVLATYLMQGSNAATWWAIPIALACGALIGVVNGLGVVALRLQPIVATLAVGGMLQSITMVVTGGTPSGDASPAVRWLVTGQIGGMTPLGPALLLFASFATVLLARTPFARRLIAVGSNPRAAALAGVPVARIVVLSYVISGVCAAIAGILLSGFLGRSSLTMGDSYVLPSIASVVVGGTLITGGRGHYVGILGGVLALTGLQILLSGTPLPPAARDIAFGVVIMAAVLSLREK